VGKEKDEEDLIYGTIAPKVKHPTLAKKRQMSSRILKVIWCI
jgi:hypothetical protein